MKDTSGLTPAQLDTRVKWASRGALIAGVCCVAALGVAAAGVSAAALLGTGASAKLGLSAAFMGASSAVKSFLSNRICTALKGHYEKEQVRRGETTMAPPEQDFAKKKLSRIKGALGTAFNQGMTVAKRGFGTRPTSDFIGPTF
ncbi:MAG TPA: hypothetical protein VEF76_14965 [Patescibacteria group bacterium]|nr:hypothetical protein [Patescibacteria group bacterium]